MKFTLKFTLQFYPFQELKPQPTVRVKSAGPGVSKALSEKIALYRYEGAD